MATHEKKQEKAVTMYDAEIVYCGAVKCNHYMGRGKCNVVHTVNSDDKISVGADGRCENFFVEQRG